MRHGGGVVAGTAALGDGLDPVAQVSQGVLRQQTQLRVHVRRLRKAGIEELLAGPGGFAEVAQADHARAALERVEGAAHRRHVLRVVRRVGQPLDGGGGVGDDFARFFDEDLAHLDVVFETRAAHRGGFGRRHRCRRRQGLGHGRTQASHGGCQLRTQLARGG